MAKMDLNKMTRNEELEKLYKLYPKKLGKSPGMRTARRLIKTDKDLKDLEKAILNYRTHLEKNRTEPKYILYFSTFMNQWTDWLDESHGESDINQTQDKWTRLKQRG